MDVIISPGARGSRSVIFWRRHMMHQSTGIKDKLTPPELQWNQACVLFRDYDSNDDDDDDDDDARRKSRWANRHLLSPSLFLTLPSLIRNPMPWPTAGTSTRSTSWRGQRAEGNSRSLHDEWPAERLCAKGGYLLHDLARLLRLGVWSAATLTS